MKPHDLAEVGILGMLNEQNSLSADMITDRLQHNFSKYWGFSRGVLSSAIANLKEEEYITLSINSEESKYVYYITPEGKDRLHRLIREPFETDEAFNFSNRHHVLIRLGFLHHLPEEEQTAVLNTLEDRLAVEREQWVEIQQMHERERPNDAQTGYRQDLIQLNITMLDALLEWVKGLNIHTLDTNAYSLLCSTAEPRDDERFSS